MRLLLFQMLEKLGEKGLRENEKCYIWDVFSDWGRFFFGNLAQIENFNKLYISEKCQISEKETSPIRKKRPNFSLTSHLGKKH